MQKQDERYGIEISRMNFVWFVILNIRAIHLSFIGSVLLSSVELKKQKKMYTTYNNNEAIEFTITEHSFKGKKTSL